MHIYDFTDDAFLFEFKYEKLLLLELDCHIAIRIITNFYYHRHDQMD